MRCAPAHWRVVPEEDIKQQPWASSGFKRVCVADAGLLLQATSWDTFRSFADEEAGQATHTWVQAGQSPTMLLRRIPQGEKAWPVLQEGRSCSGKLDGELWQITALTAPSGFLFILFGEEGRSWAEERLQKSAEFPGMVVLDAKENAMMETKAPYFIGRAQDEALLQLSSDVRFAFAESATTLWDDDDFDGF